MSISNNLQLIKKSLPKEVALVAVSKTMPNESILEAYQAGQRIFGENKIQEMTEKWAELPKDIEWHMIGHVQKNKVKHMAPYVSLIHGVDSFSLLKEINKQALKNNRIQSCLFQVYIAEEETKFGFSTEEIDEIIASEAFKSLENIHLAGLMGMATYTENNHQIAREFERLRLYFENLKKRTSSDNSKNIHLEILSIGMSGDYTIALQHGSTMVRIGSSIFGHRK